MKTGIAQKVKLILHDKIPPTVIWMKFGQIPQPSLSAIKFRDMSSFFR